MKAIERTHVVVIGAGLSGLAAARELARRGAPVAVLEARDRVGEPWRSRHPALRLNIHRHFAQLPGKPMTKEDGVFVRRDTVVDYLEGYAKTLPAPVRTGVTVTGVRRNGARWHVTTADVDYECAHAVVATGRDRVPHIPDWPGKDQYEGEILHAASLGNVSRFDGKRVLVVGAGNSGTDALNHLSRHKPAHVWVSVRHGPAMVPARVFGFPLHRLARLFAAMPAAVLDPAFRLTQRLFLGNLKRYGLPSHPDGGGTRMLRDGIAFAIDDGFVAALKRGRFKPVGPVAGFAKDRVYTTEGHYFSPDVVICATGYNTGLEALLGQTDALDSAGQPRHPMGEADPKNPGLWFTGFRPVFTGYFDAAGTAAKRIADRVTGEFALRAETETRSPGEHSTMSGKATTGITAATVAGE